MKTSISFIKLDLYFFDFLAVFVTPNLGAIAENWLNYGVKQFVKNFLSKIDQIDVDIGRF